MKIALITGASAGMGREFVYQIARSESRKYDQIWVTARRADRLEALKEELGDRIVPIPLDLCDPASFQTLSAKLKDAGATIGMLITAAGLGKYGSFEKLSEDNAELMVNTNVLGMMRTVRVCLPYLTSGSRIILLGSQSSFQPLPHFNIYASTKAFTLHFGRALHRELKPRGITVTTLCPGYVDTEFFEVAAKSEDPDACTNFKPLYPVDMVVEKALADAYRGRDLSIPGVYVKSMRLLSKLLPHSLVMKVWMKIK